MLEDEHDSLQQALGVAGAGAKPAGSRPLRDASPAATATLAAQVRERAAKADAARLELAHQDIREAPEALGQIQVELQQANEELVARGLDPELAVFEYHHALELDEEETIELHNYELQRGAPDYGIDR